LSSVRALVVVLLVGGCVTAIPLRGGTVPAAGKVSVVANLTLYMDEPGGIRVGDALAKQTGNFAGWSELLFAEILSGGIPGFDVNLLVGVSDRCQVGGDLSFLRGGAEVRCGFVENPDVGAAASGAAGWAFWDKGPWARAGVDVSHGVLVAGGYLSYGPELHSKILEGIRDACPMCEWSGGPAAEVRRYELRLSLPVGVASGIWQLGAVPYLTLLDEKEKLTCPRCADAEQTKLSDYSQIFGFSIVGGLRTKP
jgi:hypothetical protein